jgi:hypothetical protein
MGRKMGHCVYTLEDVKSEKVEKYRDTTGISPEAFNEVLSVPDRDTLQGKEIMPCCGCCGEMRSDETKLVSSISGTLMRVPELSRSEVKGKEVKLKPLI